MRPRTKRQNEILNFIRDHLSAHGYEPSYQKIANHFGLQSKGGIAKHIKALEKMGLIERTTESGSFRLKLIHTKSIDELIYEIRWFKNPNSYNKHEQELLYVPKCSVGFISPNSLLAITVMDDSMLDEQIRQDDIAIVETKTFVRDGEIVAALVDQKEIYLRKYYRLGSEIELVPANESYESRHVPADLLKIIGIYRSSIRPYG